MSIVIVIEILVGILVLAGAVRFAVRDTRQRRPVDPSDDSALSVLEAPASHVEPVTTAPDTEPVAPAPDTESVSPAADAELQPSEAADRV